MTGAHRGVSGLLHDIHLPSPSSVLLGFPQAVLPARYLKIFCHSALRDLQNPTLSPQDMPASPPPSMGMLCTPSARIRLPNGGLTMPCLAAHLQHHHASRVLVDTRDYAKGWLLAVSRLLAHPALGVRSGTKIY